MAIYLHHNSGGLAQLARATALHAVGQRFDSVILHNTLEEFVFGQTLFFVDINDFISINQQYRLKTFCSTHTHKQNTYMQGIIMLYNDIIRKI